MRYAGLDWAGKGWFAVLLDGDGGWDAGFYPTVWNFWVETADVERVCVDVPIGLATDRPRACDRAAREYLAGGAGSSVFLTPVRAAVYAENIEAAKAAQEAAGASFGVQNQAWSIVPRIREVDGFLGEYAHRLDGTDLRESHPEVCFAALAGGEAIGASKRSEEGRERRLDLLADHLPAPREMLSAVRERFMRPEYAPVVGTSATDDVVDAMVLAATAAADGLVTLPDEPGRDFQLGWPMEIVRPAEPG